MIPRAAITQWRREAPWSADAWVEQDLVISRAQFFGEEPLAACRRLK